MMFGSLHQVPGKECDQHMQGKHPTSCTSSIASFKIYCSSPHPPPDAGKHEEAQAQVFILVSTKTQNLTPHTQVMT